jgi:hypothetical protein
LKILILRYQLASNVCWSWKYYYALFDSQGRATGRRCCGMRSELDLCYVNIVHILLVERIEGLQKKMKERKVELNKRRTKERKKS